jgi:PAS domain S-box-containing protein
LTNERNRAKLYELLIRELEDFAVFLLDLDGKITSWNPGVERFFGYPEAEFVGRDVRDIFTPEDRATGAPEQEMNRAREEGRASDVRWHMCRDQSRVFVDGVLTAIKDEAGVVRGFSKIARAVLPHHATGSLIATMLEGTDQVIYAIDKNGRFLFANTPGARLFGRRVDELLGHTREEVLPPALAMDQRATDESVMNGKNSRLIEERFPSPGRGERVLLTTKAPWRDSDGRLIGLVASAQDVTTRIAHQNERERLLREVRRSNEELAAFSHVVAHDLRAPLRAVKIYAELLARHMEGRLDPTAREFLSFVTEGSDNMEHLIESLLRYAESEDELSVRQVSMSAVIDGLLHRLEPLIRETGATVTTDQLPEVPADPVRLLQLFQNLIVNAINYRSSEAPRIHISAETFPDEYRFAVADNGIGIAREDFGRIFAPLKRLQRVSVQGSGMGLALCRKIVERHGGRIWVESTVGKGSTFFFTLPVRPGNPPE